MTLEELEMKMRQALNRICKWRAVFAGWQLGTRPKGDPESDALRDHRELTILLRVEVNALVSMLIAQGVIDKVEWAKALVQEAENLEQAFQNKFPGYRSTDNGIAIDPKIAVQTTKNWKP